MNTPKLIFVKPQDASVLQLSDFYAMLKAGGEVTLPGLEDRIRMAELLAFALHNGRVVSIAALKRPTKAYIQSVFEKLNLLHIANRYELELGYAVTLPDYSERGLNQQLFGRLVERSRAEHLFATTRIDSMLHILEKLSFTMLGSYMGNMGSALDLYSYSKR